MGMSIMCILTMNHLHTYLSNHISMLAKLAGWHLAELELKVHYVPGKEKVAADVLSRYG